MSSFSSLTPREAADQTLAAIKDAGHDLGARAQALHDYVRAEADKLSLSVAEPGFDLAAKAFRDGCLVAAGIAAVDAADAATQRALGIVLGVASAIVRML